MVTILAFIGLISLILFVVNVVNDSKTGPASPQPQRIPNPTPQPRRKLSITGQTAIEAYQAGYSLEKKAAIVSSLYLIANIDDNIQPAELEYISKCADLLFLPLSDSIFDENLSRGAKYIVNLLKFLDKKQKEWYTIVLFELLMVTGSPRGNQATCALNILEEMGISREQFSAIINKEQAFI